MLIFEHGVKVNVKCVLCIEQQRNILYLPRKLKYKTFCLV